MLTPQDSLAALLTLWRSEQRAVQAAFDEARRERSLPERVRAGIALRDLSVTEVLAAPGSYTKMWVAPGKDNLEGFELRNGSPVLLWRESMESQMCLSATLWKVERDRIGIYISQDLPDWLETPGFNLDEDAPTTTFRRGERAIKAFMEAEQNTPSARLRDVLFGKTSPTLDARLRPPTFLDTQLNPAQQAAVTQALAADAVAYVHGPPGTGKTRTLIEIIRQCVKLKQSVLATAASNLAVDNLAERLIAAQVKVVRLGHPARVSPGAMEHTLDYLLEQDELYVLARGWMSEANALRRRIQTRFERGAMGHRERREQLAEVWSLMSDARAQIKRAQQTILERAEVICATAAGADAALLGKRSFDWVILDEATQAVDPIALVPLTRTTRAVLAGDPFQLPPTVISPQATRQGLGVTLFERACERDELVTMLVEQHRMHASIMRFPSDETYSSRLIAHDHVAGHTLDDLRVAPDEHRTHPLVFLDTAGKGWEDERDPESRSTRNPGQAERCAQEVRALVERGLAASEIAVITPYKAQVKLLRDLLRDLQEQGLEIVSVDGFQGREKEAVVLDLVRSNALGEIGFLSDTRRMNVALTRAKRQLIVIGDSATISAHSYYAAFLDAVQERGVWLSAWAC